MQPVVASCIDGIKALIVDGETGLLVSPGSKEELVAKLRRLLTDHNLAAKYGQNAKQSVKERFGLERMIDAYDDVYRTLLREKIELL